MNDEPLPATSPVFPQYEPPDPRGPQFAHPKQAKPLWKAITKMMRPRNKIRQFKPLKKTRRKKQGEV